MAIIKNTTITLLLLILVGCANQPLFLPGITPPKDGPPEYITGWKAGCETSMTAYSNSNLRTRYRTNIDGKMMAHPFYNKGWRSGNRFCNYYTSRYLTLGLFDSHSFSKSDLRTPNVWVKFPEQLDIFKKWDRRQPLLPFL